MKKIKKIFLLIYIITIIISILVLIFNKNTYYNQDLVNKDLPIFSKNHFLGTDYLGRDLLVRISLGYIISTFIAFIVNTISMIIGVIYGYISSIFSKRIDNILMRILEIISSIPHTIYTILLLLTLGQSILTIIISMISTRFITYALLTRTEVKKIKNEEYVKVSYNMGANKLHILKTHILPNIKNILKVKYVMVLPHIVFSEVFLSLIGLGVKAPLTSLGILISNGFKNIDNNKYEFIVSFIYLLIFSITFNLLGDSDD